MFLVISVFRSPFRTKAVTPAATWGMLLRNTKYQEDKHTTNLCNEDDDKQDAVGVDQALILLPGSTAAEESNGKDDATCRLNINILESIKFHTKNDDENWSVDIIVTKEVQVVLGSNLRVSSKPDESNASNSKEDVTKNHEILD